MAQKKFGIQDPGIPLFCDFDRGVAKSEDAKMAKSEDAPTREVTAAVKGGEVAETCKNDLFMQRLESKMQKGEK